MFWWTIPEEGCVASKMNSKNKPAKTKQENAYVDLVTAQPCVVCGGGPVEVHEPEQGLWFASMPLCALCHRQPHGWHGTRNRWKLRKINELQAINETVRRAFS